MTAYVKHETECDICGVKLMSTANTHIPGQAMDPRKFGNGY